MALFKLNAQKKAKKTQELRQKEVQKKEVESLNRKHLSGLRVIQKNLVYVVGLSPNIPEQEILQTLRGDKYFGQYGKISKIVVSSKKPGDVGPNGPSMGVYVTFENNADAQRCIAAVNGSQNGDRTLRAQLGTTKYCSAYLRNEICTNKNCMFLHEPGDNDDSYSRQDLSSINSANTQRPLSARPSSFASTSRTATTHAPMPHAQPIPATTQPMNREGSKDGSDSGDGSALPTTAHWATKGVQQRSRRGSLATSGAASSPAFSQAMPGTAEAIEEPIEENAPEPPVDTTTPAPESEAASSSTTSAKPERDPTLVALLKAINTTTLVFSSVSANTEEDNSNLKFPPLFDQHGGDKRRAMREHQEEARLHLDQDSQAEVHSVNEPVEEEEPESGSLQLGGEPEDRDNSRDGRIAPGFHDQRRPSTQLPIQRSSNGGPFGPSLIQNYSQNLGSLSSINGRTLTPQQQHQLLMMKSSQPHAGPLDQYPPGMSSQLSQGSGLFQGQGGHNRQSSRYSFANDNSSGPSTLKASANGKLMAQQSSMMPSGSHAQQQGSQFYGSSMPGPPPGLKSSGTPPIGGMFGQSHAFGGSMGGSIFGVKENSSDLLRDMLSRSSRNGGGGQSHDTGKREYISSFPQQYPSASSTPAPASSGFLASYSGFQTGAYQDFNQKQKKKGKKHRHANTSSSGGGGLVDLADPSILQARMQHQHQSNAGVGQGLFGGQAQGGYNPNMMYGSGFSRGW
jgi:CCR4-NOT transcription complex subunit 4